MRECLDVADRLSTKFSHYSQQLHCSILIYTMKYHVKSKFELSTLSIKKLCHFLIAERVLATYAYPIIPVKMSSESPATIKSGPAIIITLQQYNIMTRIMPLLHYYIWTHSGIYMHYCHVLWRLLPIPKNLCKLWLLQDRQPKIQCNCVDCEFRS